MFGGTGAFQAHLSSLAPLLPGQWAVHTEGLSSTGSFQASPSPSLSQPLIFRKLLKTYIFLYGCLCVKFGYCPKSKMYQNQVNRCLIYLDAHKKLFSAGRVDNRPSLQVGAIPAHTIFFPLRVRVLSVSCQKFCHWMINSPLPERQPCLGDSGVHASLVTFYISSVGAFLSFVWYSGL